MGRNKAAFGLDSVVGRGTCLPTIMVIGRIAREERSESVECLRASVRTAQLA